MTHDRLLVEIDALIEQWLLNPDPEIESVVRRHRVLPISGDLGAAYFFRPHDGQVVCCGWGASDFHEEIPSLTMGALVAGAKKYPQLKAFLPARPSDAADCLDCRGTGKVLQSAGCETCWCLGWLHDSVQVPHRQFDARAPKASRAKNWLFGRWA